MDVPELCPGPVRLRAHTEADLPRIVEQVVDPRSRRWTTVPLPYGPPEARAFLDTIRRRHAAGTHRFWAIEVDGRFAGTINRTAATGGVSEVGYGLHPDARGRGVARTALRAVVDHAFTDDGVEVITWRAASGNLASRRVAWNCGFTVDGTWRDAHVNGDRRRDDLWVGSLRAGDRRTPAHPWWEPVELRTDRLLLRPWRDDDSPPAPGPLDAHYASGMWPTGPDLVAWWQARLARMADGEGVFWCVADPRTDQAIGHVQLIGLNHPATPGTGLLGYWLAPVARGRGLAVEAVDRVLGHAFTPRTDDGGRSGLGLHRVVGRCRPENRGSARALRRLGFRALDAERSVLAPADEGGGFGDQLVFELLATDDRDAQRVLPARVPVLEAGKIRLRPWRDDDRPAADQRPDAATLRYTPPGVTPTPEGFDDWLEQRRRAVDIGRVHWCVADRDTDRALGGVLIFGIDRDRADAELGYWLHSDARGRGVLADALPAALAHAVAPAAAGGLGLQRLHARTDAENVASQRVLLRHGFVHRGTDHRSWRRQDGSLADTAYFELVTGEPQAGSAPDSPGRA